MELLENQQVVIAGNNRVCAGGYGACQHRVVIQVTADGVLQLPGIDRPGDAPVVAQHLVCGQTGGQDVFGQLLFGQCGSEFFEQGAAGDQFHLLVCRQFNDPAGRSVLQERRNQDIGVHHPARPQAHAGLLRLRSRRTPLTSD